MKNKKHNKNHEKGKRECYVIIKKLYHFLSTHPNSVAFKKIGGNVWGYYDDDTEEITIDFRGDIVPTLIHEFLHHLYPKWCESKIVRMERHMMRYLTGNQCRNIFRMLGDSLY